MLKASFFFRRKKNSNALDILQLELDMPNLLLLGWTLLKNLSKPRSLFDKQHPILWSKIFFFENYQYDKYDI